MNEQQILIARQSVHILRIFYFFIVYKSLILNYFSKHEIPHFGT